MLERLKLRHLDGNYCTYTMVYNRSHKSTDKFARKLREGAKSDLGVIYRYMVSDMFITVTFYRKYSEFRKWFEAKVETNNFFSEKYFFMENIPLILEIEEELEEEQVIAINNAAIEDLEVLLKVQAEFPMTYRKLQAMFGQKIFSMKTLNNLLLSTDTKEKISKIKNLECLVSIQEDTLRDFFKRKTST